MPFPEFILPLDPCNAPVQRCPVGRERASRRVLIMRTGSHGDILMATPLLAALRAAHPNCWITWIIEHTDLGAMDANPYIDEIIVWDGNFWKDLLEDDWKDMRNRQQMLGYLWLRHALKMRRRLRRRRFDVFINLQAEHWPTLAQHAGAPVRIGVFGIFPQFDPDRPEYRRFYTTSYTEQDLPPHRTDIQLLPLRALGLPDPDHKRMVLGYTAEDAASVDTFLGECGVFGRFVVLAPTTTWPSRNWPWERFAELGDRLTRETGCRVVMIGSSRERAEIERTAAHMRTNPVRAAGLFSFRQMAALVGRASVLVSGDTGPMHVAAAVGTPYVALFGPTPVPGRAPLVGAGVCLMHPVPCGPCERQVCPNVGEDHLLCMRLITVQEAVSACLCQMQVGDPSVVQAPVAD